VEIKNIEDILNLAITQEVKAGAFYTQVGEIAEDPKVKHFFKSLAEEEVIHEQILTSIKEQKLFDNSLSIESFSELKKICESHDLESFEYKSDMTIAMALEVALTREYKAFQLFNQLANLPLPEEAKTLFSKLAQEEKNHHATVEEQCKLISGTMGQEG